MKLQHINIGDYNIIVTDEEINKGDYYITEDLKVLYCINKLLGLIYGENDYGRQSKQLKKIIASQNPAHNLPSINYNRFEEDFGVVDVEKLAEEYLLSSVDRNQWGDELSFIDGFKKCQSLNENKFSLDDMGDLWDYCTYNKGGFKDFIKSLQKPKVTDIEVEMEILPQAYGNGRYSQLKITNNKIKITKILS